ncbi:WD40-repeat-containing domain protein [Globomyces pollinis-pini]|nr:WD40-repeat-containing domain protein [Globomyces pollinis-pini]
MQSTTKLKKPNFDKSTTNTSLKSTSAMMKSTTNAMLKSTTNTMLTVPSDGTNQKSQNYFRKTNQTMDKSANQMLPLASAESKSGVIKSKMNVENRKERWITVQHDGEDATPQNLAFAKHSNSDGTTSSNDMAANRVKETVADLLNHLELMGGGGTIDIHAGQKSMTFTSTSSQVMHESIGDRSIDVHSQFESSSEISKDLARENNSAAQLPGLSLERKQKEVDPSKIFQIVLQETETMFLLSLPSICVSSESIDESTIVKAQNAKYKELKSIIPNNDNYVSKAIQTFVNPNKNKDIQATSQKNVHAEVMVNQWAIYDAFNEQGTRPITSESDRPKVGDTEFGTLEKAKSMMIDVIPEEVAASTFVPEPAYESVSDSRNSIGRGGRPSVTTASKTTVNPPQNNNPTTPSDNFVDPKRLLGQLSLVERAVVGNNYMKKLISFRNVPDDGDNEEKRLLALERQANEQEESHELESNFQNHGKDDEKLGNMSVNTIPTLQLLWGYRCDLTRGRQVTYLCWNKQNEDILAVAYGESRLQSNVSPGLILCWSAKNPEWPDKIYPVNSPVTAIDFSKSNPGLLAVGFHDGRVAIYDVRKPDKNCVLDSENNGKHRDPVWELKWVERERVAGDEQSRGETLVSVSTDGRVTQWMIRKGLEYMDLMLLKRISKQKSNGTKGNVNANSFIARQAGGLCFDFNSKDSNTYIVGTEDGQIHRCSCSYNEQYLNTYSSHTGPINKVKYSPFVPTVFLSCSSDWTIRLWNQDSEEEVFKFQSGRDTINDISWSPLSATYFGTVSSNGRLEIWDLEFSVLDPIINHNVLDRQLTAVAFASQSPVVITGDDYGAVTFYKLCRQTQHSDSQDTCSGIISPFAKSPITDEGAQQWRLDQQNMLLSVIQSKVTGIPVPSG